MEVPIVELFVVSLYVSAGKHMVIGIVVFYFVNSFFFLSSISDFAVSTRVANSTVEELKLN